MRIQVVSKDNFASAAADVITQYLSVKRDIQVCFTAGKTPIEPYREMVRRFKNGQFHPQKVTAFTLDEYAGIRKTDPHACFQTLSKHLYQGMDWPQDQLITYNEGLSVEAAAENYEESVVRGGGFELSILGIGVNGHVGFNEPGTSFDSRTHVAELAAATIRQAHDEGWGNAPKFGLTLGIGTLRESKHVLLIANGRNKADIVARIVDGDISETVPATAFREHPDSLLLIDEQAASQL
ncbi:glucosamine-6-phosphate deaminase [Alicyclobacillus ferrooxydans]|uniref:Glucosamine/galactosamine-6-phosphate isomerase domain-containing protein n=1 Tax=Alicyclobacillus ferrooxydans TaxID=471514 RepID=A0A0P9EL40_9BACL|nr:glucosamine-6-phosphate deaminase [Alicyclobacillus ferrooxydans]KPV43936.1 hypothetical protein AN477_09420 [Alicyclobacillus ferrooxydans]